VTLDRVRLLQLREELREERAALTADLRAVEAALAGVVKLLAAPRPKVERNAAIVAAVQGGEEQKDVANRFNITQQRVSQIVKANLPDPRQPTSKE
jgi:hypothetical protein